MEKITVKTRYNEHTFEIIDHVPAGYQIWNIGKNMTDGYLPLCKVIPNSYDVEINTLKAIKMDGAQVILSAIEIPENSDFEISPYLSIFRISPLSKVTFS